MNFGALKLLHLAAQRKTNPAHDNKQATVYRYQNLSNNFIFEK